MLLLRAGSCYTAVRVILDFERIRSCSPTSSVDKNLSPDRSRSYSYAFSTNSPLAVTRCQSLTHRYRCLSLENGTAWHLAARDLFTLPYQLLCASPGQCAPEQCMHTHVSSFAGPSKTSNESLIYYFSAQRSQTTFLNFLSARLIHSKRHFLVHKWHVFEDWGGALAQHLRFLPVRFFGKPRPVDNAIVF